MDNLDFLLEIESAVETIKNEYMDTTKIQDSSLESLRSSISKYFTPRHLNVMSIYFTRNIDLPLFGIMVGPILNSEDTSVDQIMNYGSIGKIKTFNMEIDSKLFDLGFESNEIVALMLYNINHMTSDNNIGERLKDIIHAHLINTDTYIKYKESVQYKAILDFGILDTLVKLSNALYLDIDVETDAYMVNSGLGEEFANAINKLRSNTMMDEFNSNNKFKFAVLYWCLNVYKDVKKSRIPAINQLKRSKELNPSIFYKRIIDRVIEALYKIDTDSLVNESYMNMAEQNEFNTIVEDKYEIETILDNKILEMFDRASTKVNCNLSKIDKIIRENKKVQGIYEEYNSYLNLKERIKNLLVKE